MKLLFAALCALAYVALFELNRRFFSAEFSWGVNYIFLPAGMRLFAVLLLGAWGALGISLGSMYLVTTMGTALDPVGVFVVGLISGFSPLLAKRLAERSLGLDTDPRRLSAPVLFKLSLVFAVISAFMHQVWFVGVGHSPSLLEGFVTMAIGDLVGTMIFLYAIKAIDSLVLGLLQRARR